MNKQEWRIYIRNLNQLMFKAVKVYAKSQHLNIGQWFNKAMAAQLRADVAHKPRPCPFCLTKMIDKKTAGITVIVQDRKTYPVYCCQECGKARGK